MQKRGRLNLESKTVLNTVFTHMTQVWSISEGATKNWITSEDKK